MTQWIKNLLSKHKHQNLDPKTHIKAAAVVVTHKPSTQKTEMEILGQASKHGRISE